jgi:ATP-dependent Clp protease ATP-binding subunit ClpB
LSDRKITLRVSEAMVDHLIAVGFDAKMGARPLSRKINDLIKVPVSKKMVFGEITEGSIIEVNFANNAVTFAAAATTVAVAVENQVEK